MNRWVDIVIFMLVIAFPLVMTWMLITDRLELWFYLSLHGTILCALEIVKKLEH